MSLDVFVKDKNHIYRDFSRDIDIYFNLVVKYGNVYGILPNFNLIKGKYIRVINSFYVRFDNLDKQNSIYGLFFEDEDKYLYVYYPVTVKPNSEGYFDISTNRSIVNLYEYVTSVTSLDDMSATNKIKIRHLVLNYLESNDFYYVLNYDVNCDINCDPIVNEYVYGTRITTLSRKYGISKQRVEQKVRHLKYLSAINIKRLTSKYKSVITDINECENTVKEIANKGLNIEFVKYIIPIKSVNKHVVRKKIIPYVNFNNDLHLLNYVYKRSIKTYNGYIILRVPTYVYMVNNLTKLPIINILNIDNTFYYYYKTDKVVYNTNVVNIRKDSLIKI